ncbi:alpha/beta hydrolase [Companilactobacillus sp.]|jgi:alpha-beta hydrolase superfamily lysophospholipase|uniref:alpha/beta hydrolase n=1 Tax=Companilactobacillus sp. TaxID=2767905 RepID=UPI0025BDC06E|nr:alpha/beta hydrolase [Companilactobacillus sp.]MCH4008346.1 lysophospholipase [Companilactobacillus sp.]MCH4051475.1 lysophospholipase [Companilactobacillus sp.]MCH4076289.1 lysophospholipase [Companilactobacillus sp.]MCH4124864.1 lysophospholipase [Companilactobacillus sp.]MCH4131406.1 lysophospholipase [Companilactobacillus sp.]
MDFVDRNLSRHFEEMIESSTKGTNLYQHTDLTNFPYANVVIAHGLAEHSGRYETLANFFLTHHMNVFRYDQRGHGKSEGKRGDLTNTHELPDDCKIVVDIAKSQFPDLPTFLLGHSMGGHTVLKFATDYPGYVDGIIATDPLSIEFGTKVSGDPESYVPNNLGDGVNTDPRVTAKYNNDPMNLKEYTVRLMNTLQQSAAELKEDLPKISDPLLLLHGQADGIIPVADSFATYQGISSEDKEIHVYPHLMHEILNEPSRKWEIYEEILYWIKKHSY